MRQDKPSQTAVWIIKGILYLHTVYPQLTIAHSQAIVLYQSCLQELKEASWLKKIQSPFYRYYFKLLERITIPGIFVHYVLRKKKINDWMSGAIEQGAEQVIVLAAGFDALSLVSCNHYSNIQFIEIDHPATQKVKIKAVNSIKLKSSNMRFVECDLSQHSLISILTKTNIDPSLKTFFICEGLTMYLTEDNVKQLFNDIKLFFKNELLIAFSFMEKQQNGSFQFKNTTVLTLLWLMMNREVFKWGINVDSLKNSFLPMLGFEVIDRVKTVEMNDIFKTEQVAIGENLCLARSVVQR